ncbi:MAG TPA: acyltransferase family protein [Salinimicrobium sp.]|nr:acyltransferase family protein [Salinimicrobium sp.]
MRLKNIDLFKGILIVLVILGHVLQGKMDEAIWRTIIYSFHMPLFIGISGFLFSVDRVVGINLIALIKKYLFRVIIPWTIAVVIYFSLSIIQNDNLNVLTGLIKSFISPFYHLWFIPGFLSWIVLTWILKKIITGDKLLLIIGLLISVFSIVLKKYPEIYQDIGVLNSGIRLVLHTFRPYFYFFFVFGIIYKRLELKKPRIFEYILPLICFVFVINLFYSPNKLLWTINFFLFNSFLLSLTLKVSANNLIRGNKTIEWIGLNSLAIYLWHVLPILVCKFAIGTENLTIFYSVTIFMELVFLIAYYYLLRINILRKYVFGM